MKQFRLLIAVCVALSAGLASADVVSDISNAIENFAADEADVRFEALKTVVGLGKPAAAQLVKALNAEEALVRMYACKALTEIADPEAQAPLQTTLEESESAAVRAAAAEALAAYKGGALEALRKAAAEDPEPYVRKSAAIAIATVRSKPAIDLLVWLLKSPVGAVREIAADNLRDITLQNFDTDYEAWKKWWLDNRDDFKLTMQVYPYHPVNEEE